MPILVTSDKQLHALIPNQLVAVKGELSLFDKISEFLDSSESWLFSNFFSENLIDSLPASVLKMAARIVALDAFRAALPMLDVVVTPNGFATVGTQNLVAASKARIDRLQANLLCERDHSIALMADYLLSLRLWLDTEQSRPFCSTLFPSLSSLRPICGEQVSWDDFLKLRPQIAELEASLAEEWISPELMEALRFEQVRGFSSKARERVASLVKTQIADSLKGGTLKTRFLADIVTFIRNRPGDFPEWHDSDVADLFHPPVFRNKKNSGGYFF